ncbi:MAG: 16S rRNA (guanine(527)-N(7))-methyltransferase RsmG [Desulfuromonadaceae bacterium]|nr:16S rRNA (guanine(527)-N(7))-methyltransferase RsmG [Desulfuromonadaceae bacterium]MDD2850194.1 16S rRNA (guanine(527)-N(7))-methyltransferase RsmG [Desulfuromonadaceae bacterium]MDD4131595.1 16S rRNA (guanine(527)-N(7))-methyltransferase RsmG [Desulfuromonadaceae bacterium]
MNSIISDILSRETVAMGLSLSTQQLALFEAYAAELVKWNKKVNLTAITKVNEIAIKHFVDSLSLAPYIASGDRLLDIGSGAGLPIIPLKIINPETVMISVDAVAKKIHFQRHVIRVLGLQNIEAIHTRIEDLHKTHSHSFSIITSRAFTRLDRFVSLAAPLLAEGGILIAMKGDQAENEIEAADAVVHSGGFTVASIQRYSLPHSMGERTLTFIKQCKTA